VKNPLQERADIGRAIRAAKGDEQNGVEQNRTLTYAARGCQRQPRCNRCPVVAASLLSQRRGMNG
jgi:hypothetical protein